MRRDIKDFEEPHRNNEKDVHIKISKRTITKFQKLISLKKIRSLIFSQ